MTITEPVIGELVRARSWDDYVGQDKLKNHLDIKIQAAVNDGRQLDHMLLVAPPGAGKTTLAALIAERVGDLFLHLLMPMPFKDFVREVDDFDGGVILLDELHAAPKAFQEELQPALEDGQLRDKWGDPVDCRHVTFIGATTTATADKILEPVRDRFKYHPVWVDYSDDDMGGVVAGMARRAGVKLDAKTCQGLARAAGGTPRVASDLVAAARDLISIGRKPDVAAVLDLAGYDEDGLTAVHLEYLSTLLDIGGQAGLSALTTMLRTSPASIQNVERLLTRRGYVRREPTGRRLLQPGKDKLLGTTRENPRIRRATNGAT